MKGGAEATAGHRGRRRAARGRWLEAGKAMGVGDLHADGGTVSAHRARSEMARACTTMGTGAHGDEASQGRRVRGRHGERRRER